MSYFTLYLTILFPGSSPQEAVMTSEAFESTILLASSCEAKPPNTTEWIAPILEQANIANKASGI